MLKYVSTLRHVNRFVAVGVINTAVYYGLYLFLRTVIPYLAAHVIAIFIVMLGSFFLKWYWTFETPPTCHKLALFPFTNATNYLVTTLGVFVLVEWFGVDQRWAPLIAAAAAIPVTFVLSRWVLIGAHEPDPVAPATPGPLPE